jgi:hypothetical protein
MASTIPPILIQLQADVSQLKAGLLQATNAIKGVDDNVKKASTGMSNFMTKIKQVGATMGVAFAGQQITQFSKQIVMAASDMNETMTKTSVIFGDGFEKINQFAEASANAMGMSKKSALDASATFALFGKSAGLAGEDLGAFSGDLVTLAADFASFYNTSPEEAITSIGAALRGESEPIRKYNVLINDASLKQEALRMGLIKTTTGALSPQTRVLAAQALILKQSTDAQGDFARTADGAANTMRILSANMENAKAKLGEGLLPAFQAVLAILKPIIAGLAAFGTFLASNKESVTAFIMTLTALTAAWGVYTLVVKRAAIQQAILNAVQKINPIGAIVVAVALLVAGMVKLFNSNEKFRKAVITMAKAALQAFAAIVPMVGQVFEAIMKVTTGPLRLFLLALSKLPKVGKYAKAGLDLMNKGLDGISDFAKSAAKKADELSAKLDKVGTVAEKNAKKVEKVTKGGKDGKGGVVDTTAAKEAADKAKEILEKKQQAEIDYIETSIKAHETYQEKVADIQARYNETTAEASKDHAKEMVEISKDYAKRTLEIEADLQEKIAELNKSAAEKRASLTIEARKKEASIVQQSVDRLRQAFASKLTFNIADSFDMTALSSSLSVRSASGWTTAFSQAAKAGTDKLLADLKEKLQGAKDLQENAAKLAGLGYSQTFIEEVVKNGPEAGNKIAAALLQASPEATKEMQTLYNQVEKISDSGLDSLAKSMNAGGQLATRELMDAYSQVAVDLKDSLAEVNSELQSSLADAQNAYTKAMNEAKIQRDERILEAATTLKQKLAEAQATMDTALADAQKTLQKALLEAQKSYETAVDQVAASTAAKLAALKIQLAEVAAATAALQTAQAAKAAIVNTPYIPYGSPGSVQPGQPGFIGPVAPSTTVNINGTNLTNPTATANSVVNAIKYGTTVNTTTLAGIAAASASKSSTSSVNTTQGVSNKLKAMGLL